MCSIAIYIESSSCTCSNYSAYCNLQLIYFEFSISLIDAEIMNLGMIFEIGNISMVVDIKILHGLARRIA